MCAGVVRELVSWQGCNGRVRVRLIKCVADISLSPAVGQVPAMWTLGPSR
jgi:hypothetical protein